MTGSPSDRPDAAPARARVVLLTAGGAMGWSVANALARQLGQPITMLTEETEAKHVAIRRRARLRGKLYVLGQIATFVPFRLLSRLSRARRREICSTYGLDPTPGPMVTAHAITSVNGEDCRAILTALAPQVVAVYGTRIIRAPTLRCVSAPFINYHAGINPKYRGQDPGYWALVNGDRDNAGVTIHLVDTGVDTGAVLYQSPVDFTPADNITTYQWLQMGVAIPLFARAIEDALAGRLAPRINELPSMQWFPPTLWSYAWNGVTRGVW